MVTRPEAETISLKTSLKQLGIWLKDNKQKNVKAVRTAGQPVAVLQGLMDQLVGFATQYGLGALKIGPGVGSTLQADVGTWFKNMGSFIDTNIAGGAFSSVYNSVTEIAGSTAAGNVVIESCKAASEACVAPLTARGLATQFTENIKSKIDVISSWSRDLYKLDLNPGDANYSMEMAFNTIDNGFTTVTKALQLGEELKLTDTISAAANTTVQSSVNAKMSDLQAKAADPGATNLEVQAAMDEVQTETDILYAEVLANQAKMADALAIKLLLEETGNIKDNLLNARTRITEATAEGDTTTVTSTEQWVAVYRAGLNPDLLQLVDDLIAITDADEAGPAMLETTVAAKPVDNNNQLVGQLPT